jgi:hypothetical protein
VRAFRIEGCAGGHWKTLVEGAPIGYKRIERLDAIGLEALRLRITEAVDTPKILQFAAYSAANGALPEGDTTQQAPAMVADWGNVKVTGAWQTVEVDLTPVIRTPGEYVVEIQKTGGDATLDVAETTLLIAGVEAPRLITRLETGFAWRIRRTDQVTNDAKGRTSLRLRIRSQAGSEWRGEMIVRGGP